MNRAVLTKSRLCAYWPDFLFSSEQDGRKGTCVKGWMDRMKQMVFCFIYSSMLGKSFPYGERIFIHSCLLFSVVFH